MEPYTCTRYVFTFAEYIVAATSGSTATSSASWWPFSPSDPSIDLNGTLSREFSIGNVSLIAQFLVRVLKLSILRIIRSSASAIVRCLRIDSALIRWAPIRGLLTAGAIEEATMLRQLRSEYGTLAGVAVNSGGLTLNVNRQPLPPQSPFSDMPSLLPEGGFGQVLLSAAHMVLSPVSFVLSQLGLSPVSIFNSISDQERESQRESSWSWSGSDPQQALPPYFPTSEPTLFDNPTPDSAWLGSDVVTPGTSPWVVSIGRAVSPVTDGVRSLVTSVREATLGESENATGSSAASAASSPGIEPTTTWPFSISSWMPSSSPTTGYGSDVSWSGFTADPITWLRTRFITSSQSDPEGSTVRRDPRLSHIVSKKEVASAVFTLQTCVIGAVLGYNTATFVIALAKVIKRRSEIPQRHGLLGRPEAVTFVGRDNTERQRMGGETGRVLGIGDDPTVLRERMLQRMVDERRRQATPTDAGGAPRASQSSAQEAPAAPAHRPRVRPIQRSDASPPRTAPAVPDHRPHGGSPPRSRDRLSAVPTADGPHAHPQAPPTRNVDDDDDDDDEAFLVPPFAGAVNGDDEVGIDEGQGLIGRAGGRGAVQPAVHGGGPHRGAGAVRGFLSALTPTTPPPPPSSDLLTSAPAEATSDLTPPRDIDTEPQHPSAPQGDEAAAEPPELQPEAIAGPPLAPPPLTDQRFSLLREDPLRWAFSLFTSDDVAGPSNTEGWDGDDDLVGGLLVADDHSTIDARLEGRVFLEPPPQGYAPVTVLHDSDDEDDEYDDESDSLSGSSTQDRQEREGEAPDHSDAGLRHDRSPEDGHGEHKNSTRPSTAAAAGAVRADDQEVPDGRSDAARARALRRLPGLVPEAPTDARGSDSRGHSVLQDRVEEHRHHGHHTRASRPQANSERREAKLRRRIERLRRRCAKAEGRGRKEEAACVVCLGHRPDTVVAPCRHMALCWPCAVRVAAMDVAQCPVCRGGVDGVSFVFR